MAQQWNWLYDLISLPFICIVMLVFDVCFHSIITFSYWLFPNAMRIPQPILYITVFIYSTALGLLFIWVDRRNETS